MLVAVYVAAVLATVAALGLFVSTLTAVPVAAMSAIAIVVVLAEILDAVPQLSPIHPLPFTHDWLAFGNGCTIRCSSSRRSRPGRARRLERRPAGARLDTPDQKGHPPAENAGTSSSADRRADPSSALDREGVMYVDGGEYA
jgi:hypothetical protein